MGKIKAILIDMSDDEIDSMIQNQIDFYLNEEAEYSTYIRVGKE